MHAAAKTSQLVGYHNHVGVVPIMSAADTPMPPGLLDLFAQLDAINPEHADGGGDHSVASDAHQTRFYAKAVAAAGVRTVCEIGFNWGHSAALWLHSSPTVRVFSFDRGAPQRSLDLLWRRYGAGRNAESKALQGSTFRSNADRSASAQSASRALHRFDDALLRPSFATCADRLTFLRGRSENSVPKLLEGRRPPTCDLVSIDGAHTYQNVMADVIHLSRLARPGAAFLIDDVCDPAACDTARPSVRQTCRHRRAWLRLAHTKGRFGGRPRLMK